MTGYTIHCDRIYNPGPDISFIVIELIDNFLYEMTLFKINIINLTGITELCEICLPDKDLIIVNGYHTDVSELRLDNINDCIANNTYLFIVADFIEVCG